MTFDIYVPRPGYSVRPPDLPAGEREAMRAQAPPTILEEAPAPAPARDRAAPVKAGGPAPWTPAPVEDPPRAPGPDPGRRGRKGSRLRRLAEIPALVAGALVLAFLLKTFLVQAFYIPSGSMVPALEVGDRVLVEKVSYRFRAPQRGEVVVFERPGVSDDGGVAAAARSFFEDLGLLAPQEEVALIKRILGLPGETFEVREGTVLVDGQPLEEGYVLPDDQSFAPVIVPEDSYYLLGDNRGNSDDSRYSLGAVPRDAVVGRAFVVLWPPGNASLSLRRHYAGVHTTTSTGPRAPAITPPALPTPDAPEAPPP